MHRLIIILISIFSTYAYFDTERVLLAQIDKLYFHTGTMTNAQRGPPIPQITCWDTNGLCWDKPLQITCSNLGIGKSGIEWDCVGSNWHDNTWALKNVAISCEGYQDKDDPYVLEGSCGVSFYVDKTNKIKLVNQNYLFFEKYKYAIRNENENENGNASAPTYQLNCVGECVTIPDKVKCTNVGMDKNNNVLWECNDVNKNINIVDPHIVCVEHLARMNYVIRDSCALYFSSPINVNDKQDLHQVSTFYFNERLMTKNKNIPPVQQLICRNCNLYAYYPASVKCDNIDRGLISNDPAWKCRDIWGFSKYDIVDPDVNCELYDLSSHHVVKGSCGLSFSIEPNTYSMNQHGNNSTDATTLLVLLLLVFLIFMLYIDFCKFSPTIHFMAKDIIHQLVGIIITTVILRSMIIIMMGLPIPWISGPRF
jgi:hypothetical protein